MFPMHCHRFSIRKHSLLALDDEKRLRFLVTMSPAFENSRSLATEVAGTASILRATEATVSWILGFVLPSHAAWRRVIKGHAAGSEHFSIENGLRRPTAFGSSNNGYGASMSRILFSTQNF